MENLPMDYFVNSQAFTKQTYRDIYPAIDPAAPSNSQAGKVILITGASKGLGRAAFAASFAKANPKGIVLLARSAEALVDVAKEIGAVNPSIDVLSVATDVTNIQSVNDMFEKVKTKFGHADVLVNNAGTSAVGPIKDVDEKEWWNDFEVNVHGAFLITQGFLRLLGDKKGTVINLTTGAAHTVFPAVSSYSLSKLVSLQLAAFLVAENPNITAISLHPGVIMTGMTWPDFKRFALDTPELVGGVGVWLSTSNAEFLTGRYVSANWSVEELIERKEEIVKENKLTIALTGKFGMEQFA